MVTSAPVNRGKNPQVVEERLEQTCKKLSEVEINIGMFRRMVATNDVRNFITK